MNKNLWKLGGLAVLSVTVMLYVAEWLGSLTHPSPATKAAVAASISSMVTNGLSTNAIGVKARMGLILALDHVRDEMTKTTNAADLSALRAAENALTNVLARP